MNQSFRCMYIMRQVKTLLHFHTSNEKFLVIIEKDYDVEGKGCRYS